MNLFFYLHTFILNYSFIVILSDHIFCTLFYYNTTVCKTETCENGEKIPERSRSVLGRFYCTMTNRRTIILQIITFLLNVSTLFCHLHGVRSQYLAKLHKYVKCSCWQYTLHLTFKTISHMYQYVEVFRMFQIVLFIVKWNKII